MSFVMHAFLISPGTFGRRNLEDLNVKDCACVRNTNIILKFLVSEQLETPTGMIKKEVVW
jgi:hypothetical protein